MENNSEQRRNIVANDTTVFLSLIGLGFVLALVAGFLTEFSPLLCLFVPPIILTAILWGYRGYCLDTLRLSDEEAGDSLYYMGFLFTTTSLAAGLIVIGIRLQGSEGTAGSDLVLSFLPPFGAALVTTIVGLCMRVVLSRGVGDIDTVYSDLKDQLHQTAADLKTQADLTTDQLRSLLVMIKQKVEEVESGFRHYSDSLQAAFHEGGIKESSKHLQQSAAALKSVADHMSESSTELNTRLAPLIQSLSAVIDTMKTVTVNQTTALDGLAKRIAMARSAENNTDYIRQQAQIARVLNWCLTLLIVIGGLLLAILIIGLALAGWFLVYMLQWISF